MKIDNTQGELIKRIFVGTAVWEEKQRLAKHENVKRKMLQQWDSVEGLPEAKDIEDRIWDNIRCHFDESGKEKCRRISIMRVAIVAACLILLCGTGLWWLVQDDNIVSPVQIETITYNDVYAHESKLHVLPDSSKVWMKAGSHLRYANDFTRHRKIWLDGEAVFEVTKKYGMPFQVHIDRAFVEVKGTVFNVATNLGETDEVSLYEGAVEFNLMNEKQKVLMCPGQRIVYNADNESFQLENIGRVNWENGYYRFVDIPIAELCHDIGCIYHVGVELSKRVPLHYRFTGFIGYDEPLENVFKKIAYTTGLEIRLNNGKYIMQK